MGVAPWSMTRCCVNKAEEKLFRIAVVKLGQNVVGQKDAGDHPEPLPMMTPGRVEVLVIGLEEAEVQPVSIPARSARYRATRSGVSIALPPPRSLCTSTTGSFAFRTFVV